MPPRAFSSFSFRNLTPQLFLLVILPLVVLLFGISLGGLTLHQQAMRGLVAERDERAVRAAAATLEEQIVHRKTAVLALALRVRPETPLEELPRILESSPLPAPDFDLGFSYLARGGDPLAHTGDAALWEAFSIPDHALRPLFARDAPPALIQTVHPRTGAPIMLVTASAFKGGPLAVGAFSPAELAQRILPQVFTPGERSVAFMIDGDGLLIYQAGQAGAHEISASHPGVMEALAGESGALYTEANNREYVVAYSPIPSADWALVIEEPWEEVTNPLLRTTENAPLVLLPALVLAVLALWFGLRQVVQPLQALGVKAAAVGGGDFETIEQPVGGIEEIRQLQTELIRLARKVHSAQRGLRGYIGAMTTGQEEERRRLARELHDDTLQALIALNQRVQLARLSPNRSDGEALAEIQDLIAQTLANLRRITRALRPVFLEELGLAAALEALADDANKSQDLEIIYRQTGEQQRLTPIQELSIYRIAQEALNNVIKHARASQAVLSLEYGSDQVALRVTDDGRGFNVPDSPAELTPQGHFGLLGLYERADLIGARLHIESAPGAGTIVTVTAGLPAVQKEETPK